MSNIRALTDDDLRRYLFQSGFEPGPITVSTRAVYERKLQRILSANENQIPIAPQVQNSDSTTVISEIQKLSSQVQQLQDGLNHHAQSLKAQQELFQNRLDAIEAEMVISNDLIIAIKANSDSQTALLDEILSLITSEDSVRSQNVSELSQKFQSFMEHGRVGVDVTVTELQPNCSLKDTQVSRTGSYES